MPIKKITKSDVKTSKITDKKAVKKPDVKSESKKDTTKKVVIKRRKSDLKPTKASAVAIASQANRAKQALIEKVASSEITYRKPTSSDTKIPLWVWIFFWCSLLLFCVSFYKAIIYPQLNKNVDSYEVEKMINWNDVEKQTNNETIENDTGDENLWNISQDYGNEEIVPSTPEVLKVPETATEVIEEYFLRLSSRKFDEAFDLMIPALRNSSEIRDHFTSFRMNPFLDWIEWWRITPINFEYVNSPALWKDIYKFDLSYVMNSDKSNYDETREFTVNMQWGSPKISSIRCVTSKCSYHPIFWPENFGLMR